MEQGEQNEFNNAIGFIQRLDKIFYLMADDKIKQNIKGYLEALTLLFHELSTEIKEEEVNKIKKKLRDIKEEISNLAVNRIKVIPNGIMNDLEDLELDLRQIYKKSGLMMKTKKMGAFLE